MSNQPVDAVDDAPKPLFVDRRKIQQALAELHADIGFVPDHSATLEEIRARMIAEGVRPEDNSASREMIALRYPDEDTTAEGWE